MLLLLAEPLLNIARAAATDTEGVTNSLSGTGGGGGGGIGGLQSSVTHPRVAIATGCATVLPRPCKTVPTVTTGVVVVAGGGGIVVAVVVGIVVAGAGGIVGGIEGAGRGTGDLLLLLFP